MRFTAQSRSWNFRIRLPAFCWLTACREAVLERSRMLESSSCWTVLWLTSSVASHIHWQSSEYAARFRHLCHSLRRRGAAQADASAELIAARLRNILANRPRLALDDAAQSVVRDWVVTARPLIVSRAPLLVFEVERRLEIGNSLER
jgi:hypothetical protein